MRFVIFINDVLFISTLCFFSSFTWKIDPADIGGFHYSDIPAQVFPGVGKFDFALCQPLLFAKADIEVLDSARNCGSMNLENYCSYFTLSVAYAGIIANALNWRISYV